MTNAPGTSNRSGGQPRFEKINRRLNAAVQENHPLIVVHRGTSGGVIVENTTAAVQAAVAHGADIVEIDVIRSTDGQFFIFHNGYEKMHFDLDADIRTLTASEIESLEYRWYVDNSLESCRIENLGDMLRTCDNTILNIDRSWNYWDTLLNFLDKFECADRVLLKCPAEAGYLEVLSSHETKYPLMPIVKSKSELELSLGYRDINLVAIEILATNAEEYLARAELIPELHRHGILVLLNALNLANGVPLFLGWDDRESVLEAPDQGWGKLIDHGADLIQTDFPALLNQYRDQKN